MSVYHKIIITMFGIGMIVIAGLYILFDLFLKPQFIKSDEKIMIQNLVRTQNALKEKAENFSALPADWAMWDDTYNFVADKNEDYLTNNAYDGWFENSGVNLLVLTDSAGKIVFQKAYDTERLSDISIPENFASHLNSKDRLVSLPDPDDSVIGMMMFGDRLMSVASFPILTSLKQGPIRGTLIMGSFIDINQINQLNRNTGIRVDLVAYDSVA